MYSEPYESYPPYAPFSYEVYNSSQMAVTGGASADQLQYSATDRYPQSHTQDPGYHCHSQGDTHAQYSGYADSTQIYNIYAPPMRTTAVHLHSPHPVLPTSASLLSTPYSHHPPSHYFPNEHHLSEPALDGPRRMSVPELHTQHYQVGFEQAPPTYPDASRRMSVPNLHTYRNEAGGSYNASVPQPSPSHLAFLNVAAPPLVPDFQNYEISPTTSTSSAGLQTQLAPHGSGADLMEYYANLNREAFQTPCQLLDSLLKTGSSTSAGAQVDPVPVEPLREQKQTETSRQARLRYMAESVGFQPTDPDTMSCHEKKRNYIECLENYVIWLRAKCELVDVDAGDIPRVQAYKGLSTQGVRTMIVHMQKILSTDHVDTLKEEGDFLHLRERVLEQEAEQANVAALARRGL